LVLLRQVDRWIGLIKSLAKRLPDKRDPDKIEHSLESMLRQRIYGLALGYEDLNDHDTLRKDLLWQTASERTEETGQLLDPVPVRESSWPQRSLANAPGALRTVH
jgi:Transposase DDE domain group 1